MKSVLRLATVSMFCLAASAVLGCNNGASTSSAAAAIPGTLSVGASSVTVLQKTGTVSVSVGRTVGSSGAVSISYYTVDLTAIAGTDYVQTTGTLSWADGDTSTKTITVPLTTSLGFDGTRIFSVAISQPTGSATLGLAAEAINVTGSGAPAILALASQTLTPLQTAGSVVLSFTHTGSSLSAVTAAYTEVDGTAIAGTDYTKVTGTVSWAAGDTSTKTVTVPLSTATYFTGTRTFTATLSSPTGIGILGNASTAVNITGGLIPPSNSFSFTGPTYTWKLTLPIDQFGGTGGTANVQYAAVEETTAQLTAGFVDSFFYADTATYGGGTNHIIFNTLSNGAVTTPGTGSDHTRSELRELYNGTGADSNGDWTSAIGGTLTATCVVQAVSVNSDEATIGQIHNQAYVFMLLIYRPATKDVAVSLYSSYGSSTQARTSIVQNVNIGDAITYKIAYYGNNIAVTVDGTTQNFAVDPSWAGTPMYFKAGAYHAAPNIGNPATDHTQVAFSSFAITH